MRTYFALALLGAASASPLSSKFMEFITKHNKSYATVEEFESFDLKREKIIPAKGKVIVIVGPLSSGEYSFFGEFHQETAQGKLIVK